MGIFWSASTLLRFKELSHSAMYVIIIGECSGAFENYDFQLCLVCPFDILSVYLFACKNMAATR
jgi:hypothetical protein